MTNSETWFWPLMFSLFVVFPLSLSKNWNGLRYFSASATIIVAFLVFFLAYEGARSTDLQNNLKDLYLADAKGLAITFPICIFSFACQSIIPDAYREL